MNDRLLLGLWRTMLPIPPAIWRRHVRGGAHLGFMSEDHHRVHNFVVTELSRVGEPLAAAYSAQALSLPLARVTPLLDELEQHMTFLFRNERGAVTWAYPVTVEPTPHRVWLSTGEQTYAA